MNWFRRRERAGADEDRNGGFGLSRPLDRAAAERLLDECCAAQRAAVVVGWPYGGVARARFARRAPDGLHLVLLDAKDATGFAPLSVATVSFSARGRATVFLAPVLGTENATLRLRLPDEIAGAEARLGFRVPVPADAGIDAQLRLADKDALPVRLVNVSVSGALVEVPARAGVELAPGALVLLLIERDGRRLALDGVVRRRAGGRYGIFFPSALLGDDAPDTRALHALLQTLLEAQTRT